jgi:hypothetical protein
MTLVCGCEKEINIGMKNESKENIVVHCILNPRKNVKLLLYYSNKIPSGNRKFSPVENATVQIFNQNKLYCELKYNDNDTISSPAYIANNKFPETGESYRLKIDIPGRKTIRAKTTIPAKTNIDTLKQYPVEKNGNEYIHFEISFRDNEQKNDYYYFKTSSFGTLTNHFFSEDPLLNWNPEKDTYCIFNDNSIDGSSYIIDIDYIPNYEKHIDIKLYSITEEAYLYYKSINKQKRKDDFPIEGVELNIPISEPVQVYSNITNGLGIFSGANESIKTVIVEN